jgi:alkanesulfonate monooxygenase SsuD/methylene tetrahydromethanopterin reductase-like flavin-dependent oxidoreductase (luciferase family)
MLEVADAAEAWGLDVVWLAEMLFNPARSVLSGPLLATREGRTWANHHIAWRPSTSPRDAGLEIRPCLPPSLQADSQSGGAAPTLTIARLPDSVVRESRDSVYPTPATHVGRKGK